MSFLDTLPLDLKEKIINVVKSIDAFNSLYFHAIQNVPEAPQKKRKTATTSNGTVSLDSITLSADQVILSLPKLLFQSPIRKKLDLIFALNQATNNPMLTAVRPDTLGPPEFAITDLSTSNIYFSAFLPMAEKPKLQMFVAFYHHALKPGPFVSTFSVDTLGKDIGPDYKTRVIRQASMCGFKIEDPFAGGDAFFVDAHKGSKEGVLYFLPNNIIFGFKKPILFYESKDIKSITYSSITRITFNVTLLVRKPDGEEERIEFSMIDQSEFSKIDLYVKAKEVEDNSMAEELKAKPVLKSKSAQEDNTAEDHDEVDAEPENNDSDDEEEDGTYQIGEEGSDDSEGSYNSEEEA